MSRMMESLHRAWMRSKSWSSVSLSTDAKGSSRMRRGAAVVEKAGNHDPGLLAAGKADASFSDYCFYTLGKGGGFFGKAGTPQRFVQISFFPKPYIIFQGGIEELHGMAHIAYERQGGICPGPAPFCPR